MKTSTPLPTRDRVGFYIVPTAFFALVAQLWLGRRTDETTLYVFIAAALILSVTPFLLTYPASWRGEVSEKMMEKVPWVTALAVAPIRWRCQQTPSADESQTEQIDNSGDCGNGSDPQARLHFN